MQLIARTHRIESETENQIKNENQQKIEVQIHLIIKTKTVVDGRQRMLNIIPKGDKKVLLQTKRR